MIVQCTKTTKQKNNYHIQHSVKNHSDNTDNKKAENQGVFIIVNCQDMLDLS